MLIINLHERRPQPFCHTGEPLAVDTFGDPLGMWVYVHDGQRITGHIHADGTHHEWADNPKEGE